MRISPRRSFVFVAVAWLALAVSIGIVSRPPSAAHMRAVKALMWPIGIRVEFATWKLMESPDYAGPMLAGFLVGALANSILWGGLVACAHAVVLHRREAVTSRHDPPPPPAADSAPTH